MSRAGDEMVFELAGLLKGMDKTAGKKKGPGIPDGTGPCAETEECKFDKKEKEEEKPKKSKKKKSKKAEAFMHTVNELMKLADTLDNQGAVEASDLVDDAIQAIVATVKSAGEPNLIFDEEEDITESFEDDEPVTGREEGMGTRVERTLQDGHSPQPDQDDTPEGLGMGDFGEVQTITEDKMDKIMADPEVVELLKEKGIL